MSLIIQSVSAWTASNPVLDLDQIGVESDSGRRKIGDGVNPWRALDYQQAVLPPGSNAAMTALQPGDDAAELGSGTATAGYVLTADGAGDADWAAVPDAVTVTDSASIDFTLTGQDITATAIFGSTAGTVCEGNDARLHSLAQLQATALSF
jgi:hypothetical protein